MSIFNKILPTIKKLIPTPLFKLLQKPYHFILSLAAVLYYWFPAKKMIVIGVTGTSGKTTAIELISKVLEGAGHKVGYTSTSKWKVAEKETLNNKKITMLGRFQTQRILQEMARAGCQYAIIETTSQGIDQFRHLGIHYDMAVITNLYSEHIEAHGSFEKYKEAKLKLFRKLANSKHKVIKVANPPTPSRDFARDRLVRGATIKKVTIANFDDEHCQSFIQFHTDENYLFGIHNKADLTNSIEMRAERIGLSPQGINFTVKPPQPPLSLQRAGTAGGSSEAVPFKLNILGEHNIYNALIAICVGVSQGMILSDIAKSLTRVKKIDGRLEKIDEGQNFTVIVDYAFEPKAMSGLYETARKFNLAGDRKKIIHVLGSAGGGRDKARRPVLGKLAAENADVVIITNEDPYDEDPQVIIDEVAAGAEQVKSQTLPAGRQESKVENIFKILDRREAIREALSLASEGDLVLITGKGCEQAIVVKDEKLVPWDDREVVREELKASHKVYKVESL